jgi:hypothetical protein
MDEEIEESVFIEYYLLSMPEYYPNVEYLERLGQVDQDIRVKFATILKKREDAEGRLFTNEEVYRIDEHGNIVEKRPKYRYVCIIPLDGGRARAVTMFEGENCARGVTRSSGMGGALIMPLAALQNEIASWPGAQILTRQQMLQAQGPCVRCKSPKSDVGLDLCGDCEALLKSMVNEEWSSDAHALFVEFTVPEFKRGGIIPVMPKKAS